MELTNLNFANPYWLWGLLLIPLGIIWTLYARKMQKNNLGGLESFVDKKLLPHILLQSSTMHIKRGTGFLYATLIFLIVVALANPRWSYQEIDAFAPTSSMVILLDLSATMNADDVSPNRIIKARQYIEDLLNTSKGIKIGMIGFAGFPHLISPITDDLHTIKNYIPALDTDLTDKQGESFSKALNMAAGLLSAEQGDKKSILLLSDGNFKADDFNRELKNLAAQNISVHVVGVGTTNGAPYKNNYGALHKQQGQVVISKLQDKLLQDIAKRSQGVYTEVGISDLGLRTILAKSEDKSAEHIVSGKIRQWEDSYYWFLLPAMAILLYLIRARIFYLFVVVVIFNVMPPKVMASTMRDLFLNNDQLAKEQFVAGNFAEASTQFHDQYRKGVALYRDGKFSEAEEAFINSSRESVVLDAAYNAGNAQMQQQKWSDAIKSYENVLAKDPDHMAAQHNLEIAKKMLEQKPEEDKSDCDCNKEDKQENNNQDKKDKDSNSEKNQEQERKEQDKSQENSNDTEQQKHDNQDKGQSESQTDLEKNNLDDKKVDEKNTAQPKEQHENAQALDPLEEARIEQWLNRVDSDIKIFLKNKFYVEDMLGGQ